MQNLQTLLFPVKKKVITMIFTSKEVEDLAKHVPICCNLSHEMLEQLERGYWQNV